MSDPLEHKPGDIISLRTQSVKHADGSWHTHFYTHWDGILACEGRETVRLTDYEAEILNKGSSFSR